MAFVAMALWKPWEGPPGGSGAGQRLGAASARPSGPSGVDPIGSSATTPQSYGPFGRIPSSEALVAAADDHANWGVRAMVLRPAGPGSTELPTLRDHWLALALDSAGEPPSIPLAISDLGDEVVAIGVTTPDLELALDVRFWAVPPNGPRQRLTAIAIPGPEAASWLWLPDRAHATERGTWQAGNYLIEVLLGPRIVRFVASIASASPTSSRPGIDIGQPPFATVLDPLAPGPFALADGGAAALVGGSSPVIDEREAWLGSAAGLPSVAEVEAIQVTGLGMVFAAGTRPRGVEVRELAPDSPPILTRSTEVVLETGGRLAMIAWPLPGGIFPDGVYRVTIAWTENDVDRTDSWAVEVLPALGLSAPSAPLDAMSRWVARLEDADGTDGEPLVFIDAQLAGSDACTPTTTVSGAGPYAGIVTPPGVEVRAVRLLGSEGVRAADVAIRVARNAIPRLTVVALPSGGLAPGDHDLVLSLDTPDGVQRIVQRICVV